MQTKVNLPVKYTEIQLEKDDWKLYGIKHFAIKWKKIKWDKNKTDSLV